MDLEIKIFCNIYKYIKLKSTYQLLLNVRRQEENSILIF